MIIATVLFKLRLQQFEVLNTSKRSIKLYFILNTSSASIINPVLVIYWCITSTIQFTKNFVFPPDFHTTSSTIIPHSQSFQEPLLSFSTTLNLPNIKQLPEPTLASLINLLSLQASPQNKIGTRTKSQLSAELGREPRATREMPGSLGSRGVARASAALQRHFGELDPCAARAHPPERERKTERESIGLFVRIGVSAPARARESLTR